MWPTSSKRFEGHFADASLEFRHLMISFRLLIGQEE